jgi:uncharacterized membrane protein
MRAVAGLNIKNAPHPHGSGSVGGMAAQSLSTYPGEYALYPLMEQQQGGIPVSANKKTLFIAQFSLLLAIEAIVCFTPLGSLPAIGPIVATLSHVPVVLTAILLGTGPGAAMGFFFGLFSFLVWTFTPPSPVIAFAFTPVYSFGGMSGNFWSLVICFVPRILIGVVSGLLFRLFSRAFARFDKKRLLTYALSGACGSLVNTLLVLLGIYVFFGNAYAQAIGVSFSLLLGIVGGTILTSGIPEAVVAAVLAYVVCYPVKKYLNVGKAQ